MQGDRLKGFSAGREIAFVPAACHLLHEVAPEEIVVAMPDPHCGRADSGAFRLAR